jgi:hypothetical protein
MDLQLAKALPWFLLALVILVLYLYVRSRRTRRK